MNTVSQERRKCVAIVQSSYIPWKGYFDLIRRADAFILYDNVQYTRRDWRNRNRIKTKDGVAWLTIPVEVKGRYHQLIAETQIAESDWAVRHFRTISAAYANAPFFVQYRDAIEELYRGATMRSLSEVNRRFLEGVNRLLGIRTPLSWSMDYDVRDGRIERLIDLCKRVGATHYLSGPSAKAYLDPLTFEQEGVHVEFMSYDGYRPYEQPHPPFDHYVSIVDLLFSVGPAWKDYVGSSSDALPSGVGR
jgi:hypothetical protein